jgi:hypothetical protein
VGVIGLFMGDAHVLEPEMRQTIQQVSPAEPVAVALAASAKTRDIQTNLILLTVKSMLESLNFSRIS